MTVLRPPETRFWPLNIVLVINGGYWFQCNQGKSMKINENSRESYQNPRYFAIWQCVWKCRLSNLADYQSWTVWHPEGDDKRHYPPSTGRRDWVWVALKWLTQRSVSSLEWRGIFVIWLRDLGSNPIFYPDPTSLPMIYVEVSHFSCRNNREYINFQVIRVRKMSFWHDFASIWVVCFFSER